MDSFNNKFVYPEHYNWPFFFTIQKHMDTRLKQLDMWANIVKEFCKANKIWKITKSFFLEKVGVNTNVNRKLNREAVNLIFNYMENTVKCVIPITCEEYFVLWKNIEEWEDLFYNSVVKHHRIDSLETLDYLINDEENRNEEFYDMDKGLLIKILKGLESKNKCILIIDNGKYLGVKFLKI